MDACMKRIQETLTPISGVSPGDVTMDQQGTMSSYTQGGLSKVNAPIDGHKMMQAVLNKTATGTVSSAGRRYRIILKQGVHFDSQGNIAPRVYQYLATNGHMNGKTGNYSTSLPGFLSGIGNALNKGINIAANTAATISSIANNVSQVLPAVAAVV